MKLYRVTVVPTVTNPTFTIAANDQREAVEIMWRQFPGASSIFAHEIEEDR